jgi:CBS domain-containing protein
MSTRNIALAEAGERAMDVMLEAPTTVGPATTVAQARAVFESPRQKLLVVCDGDRYVGAVRRDGLDGAPDDDPVGAHLAPDVPVMLAGDPSERVPDLVETSGLTRIPVVDAAGDLVGLVCFDPRRSTFCVR